MVKMTENDFSTVFALFIKEIEKGLGHQYVLNRQTDAEVLLVKRRDNTTLVANRIFDVVSVYILPNKYENMEDVVEDIIQGKLKDKDLLFFSNYYYN